MHTTNATHLRCKQTNIGAILLQYQKVFFSQIFISVFFFFSLSSQAFAAAAVEADADGDVVICICNQKVAHKLCFMLIFERTHTHTHKELDDRHFNVPRPAPSHT